MQEIRPGSNSPIDSFTISINDRRQDPLPSLPERTSITVQQFKTNPITSTYPGARYYITHFLAKLVIGVADAQDAQVKTCVNQPSVGSIKYVLRRLEHKKIEKKKPVMMRSRGLLNLIM